MRRPGKAEAEEARLLLVERNRSKPSQRRGRARWRLLLSGLSAFVGARYGTRQGLKAAAEEARKDLELPALPAIPATA